MDTVDCIKNRRSRRLFLDRPVPDELIRQVLECALAAPSSMDCQPWHFIVVKDRDKRKRLAELKSEGNQRHILTAPLTIVVCVDTDKSSSRCIEDGVTATQNILLAAHDLGLGSVYVTGCKPGKPETAQAVREIIGLPDNIMPVTILPLGYPDPEEELDDKRLPELEEVVHIDKWRKR